MGVREGLMLADAVHDTETPALQRALLQAQVGEAQEKLIQTQRLREALTQALAPRQPPPGIPAPATGEDAAPVPISQHFFGGDPETMQRQQEAFAQRYGQGALAVPLAAGGDTATMSPPLASPPVDTAPVPATVESSTPTPPTARSTPEQDATWRAQLPGQRTAALSPPPRPAAPRTAVQDTTGLQRTIVAEARKRDIDPALALSLFEAESSFDNTAVNPKSGAFSVAQFLPSTARARGLDVERLKSDPVYAVQEGLTYFKELLDARGSTAPALWAYGGATRPDTRKNYTDRIFSKYAGNLARAAGLGGAQAGAPAPGVQVADAAGDTLTDAQRMQQFSAQYNPQSQPAMQMGPPEASAPVPQTLPLPTTGVVSGDVEMLRKVGLAHLQNGDPRVGLALVQAATQQRDLAETGSFLRNILSNPGTTTAMRTQAMASLGDLLARQGKFEEAMKLMERSLPMSERELLSTVSQGTRDILLAQGQSGQPMSIRRALDEQEAQKAREKQAGDSQVVETADGTFVVDKKTGLATRVTEGRGAAAPQTPTGEPPSPSRAGKPLPGKVMTEPQAKAYGFGSRALAANAVVNQLEDTGTTGAAFGPQLLEKAGKYGREFGGTAGTIIGIVAGGALGGGVGAVPGAVVGGGVGAAIGLGTTLMADTFATLWRTPDEQLYAQARLDFIASILRKESGAAISAGEFVTEEKRYFPQPGESAPVIRQKRQARATALATLSTEAGRPLAVPRPTPPVQTPEQAGIGTLPTSAERVRLQPQ